MKLVIEHEAWILVIEDESQENFRDLSTVLFEYSDAACEHSFSVLYGMRT